MIRAVAACGAVLALSACAGSKAYDGAPQGCGGGDVVVGGSFGAGMTSDGPTTVSDIGISASAPVGGCNSGTTAGVTVRPR